MQATQFRSTYRDTKVSDDIIIFATSSTWDVSHHPKKITTKRALKKSKLCFLKPSLIFQENFNQLLEYV